MKPLVKHRRPSLKYFSWRLVRPGEQYKRSSASSDSSPRDARRTASGHDDCCVGARYTADTEDSQGNGGPRARVPLLGWLLSVCSHPEAGTKAGGGWNLQAGAHCLPCRHPPLVWVRRRTGELGGAFGLALLSYLTTTLT